MSCKKVIFFLPVDKKYLSKWEYYKVDYDILTELYSEVVVCSTMIQVLKNLKHTDLIYCWWWHQSAIVVTLSKLLGIKTCVTGAIHMFDISGSGDFYKKSFLYRLAIRITLRFATFNLFISTDQCKQITSHLTVNNPIVLKSSLTKEENFSINGILNKREKYKNPSSKVKLLSVAWHKKISYERKGVIETLYALSLLAKNTNHQFEWVIIGTKGGGEEFLASKINELQLQDHVKILLDVSVEKKRDIFLKSDLYIQPSWCEGFGNAVLEAMSYGMPSLVSRYTAQPEVVGSTGYIVMEITPEFIAEKLEKYFLLKSPDKKEMTEETLKFVDRHFTFKHRLERMKLILNNG